MQRKMRGGDNSIYYLSSTDGSSGAGFRTADQFKIYL